MIAGCIDKLRHSACGDCARRDACGFVWQGLFGIDSAGPARSRRQTGRTNPFMAFLAEVARAVESRAVPRETPLRRELERRLEPLLATGDVRIERLARELGLSRQTLYRRLKAEGATFEEVLDGLRRKLAVRFIRDQGMAVKEAAWRLGFSDPAAFSRAFKRWTGRSPSDMRPGQPG